MTGSDGGYVKTRPFRFSGEKSTPRIDTEAGSQNISPQICNLGSCLLRRDFAREFPHSLGGFRPFLICAACAVHWLESGHFLLEAATPDTAPISTPPLAGRWAEEYPGR
jgi:hypothetical protein